MPGRIRRSLTTAGCLTVLVGGYALFQVGSYKFTTWDMGLMEKQYGNVQKTVEKVRQELLLSKGPMQWAFNSGKRQAMWDYVNEHKEVKQ